MANRSPSVAKWFLVCSLRLYGTYDIKSNWILFKASCTPSSNDFSHGIATKTRSNLSVLPRVDVCVLVVLKHIIIVMRNTCCCVAIVNAKAKKILLSHVCIHVCIYGVYMRACERVCNICMETWMLYTHGSSRVMWFWYKVPSTLRPTLSTTFCANAICMACHYPHHRVRRIRDIIHSLPFSSSSSTSSSSPGPSTHALQFCWFCYSSVSITSKSVSTKKSACFLWHHCACISHRMQTGWMMTLKRFQCVSLGIFELSMPYVFRWCCKKFEINYIFFLLINWKLLVFTCFFPQFT